MSSSHHASPDHQVTIKLSFQGTIRRTKMPLRDMVPRVLEDHIRTFLHIPNDTRAKIERWSDSLGAFVELDSENTPVYKQLYRAARAKSKLKLQVSLINEPDKTIPKPVTVEDEPEVALVAEQETIIETTSQEDVSETVTESTYAPPVPEKEVIETFPQPTELPVRGPPPPPPAEVAEVLDSLSEILAKEETKVAEPTAAVHSSCFEPLGKEWAPSSPSVGSIPPFNTRSAVCPSFAVCCNNCNRNVSDAHYHCSTCDDGDYDLCEPCVVQGVVCKSDDHWLIKRTMVEGQLVNSSTETIAPKPKEKKLDDIIRAVEEIRAIPLFTPFSVQTPQPPVPKSQPAMPKVPFEPFSTRWTCVGNMRTCNCCVQELPEREFLHCTTCEDFDLCQQCFAKNGHGHHPKHAFVPAVAGTKMPDHITIKMGAGRNQTHHAICDGCDKYIAGVRNKCLDCPDWDYCSECITNANFVHPNHRFVPVYEPLADAHSWPMAQPVHMGICCDGPLCASSQGNPTYIRGVRYKCAVCNDTDFCANCEASPANEHNRTHPLIKFKTPVRHVSVTTTGEHQDGKRMPPMGDRSRNNSKSTETSSPADSNSMNAVQTVVDVKPEEAPVEQSQPEAETEEQIEPEIKKEESVEPADEKPVDGDLKAVFLRDSVADGTILPPNHVFEQTWVLRNEGNAPWPAGCSVKFVGGDYMGHVDSAHPAGISELVSASESTVCYAPLASGHEFPFTVLLRTPLRSGKIISYWRLTTADGHKFGHRLWCEVNVRGTVATTTTAKSVTPVEELKVEESSQSDSVMIFPKLEKESPHSSVHEEVQSEAATHEDIESLAGTVEEGEWDGSDDFMTDEEYDILDASDEEFLEEQQQRTLRK
ncbi:ZZ-type zinc finger-containing protein P35G2.11c [Cladobotryum mycophilum]|uniref:ZZ-type zinc finger-containing protein P35G2.11c n=1 Tax=Cladobotryum mycophilum TaxID=491253 RepID=A0ABR0S5X2_9HYPO